MMVHLYLKVLIKNLIVNVAEKSGRIDVHELSSELLVPEEEVRLMIDELGTQIINAITPYSQLGFMDLSHEVKLPEKTTVALLKILISKGKIAGSLDMVNHILIIEQVPSETSEISKICKECRYHNRAKNDYCVKCGAKLEVTKTEIKARMVEEKKAEEQKTLFVLFFFVVFAIIAVMVAHSFPALLLSLLLIDIVICFLLWFILGK